MNYLTNKSERKRLEEKKILNFIIMATLTRYYTFKSLKQSSSIKVKKAAKAKTQPLAEIESFLMLLNKKKAKAKTHKI